MVKTYRSIKFMEHHLAVTVNGREKMIPFVGGTRVPQRINGSYSTSNPDVQKALDEHPSNGSAFRCVTKSKLKEKSPAPTLELSGEEPVKVANFQQAKAYLIKECGADPEEVRNKVALEEKAMELGVKFEYV